MLILGLKRGSRIAGICGFRHDSCVCHLKAFFPYINGNFQQDHILKRSFSFTCYLCIISSLLLFFQVTPKEAYLEKFHFVMEQFFQAVSGIVAIFSYMVRFLLLLHQAPTECTTYLNLETEYTYIDYLKLVWFKTWENFEGTVG